MACCPTLPPLIETVTCDDAYTARFRASYIGKLTNIEYQNGAFTAMFGNSKIVAKLDVLPEWVQENVYAELEFRDNALKISPFPTKRTCQSL